MLTAVTNGKIVTENAILSGRALLFDDADGTIRAVIPQAEIPAGAAVADAGGGWILPGFVDIHVHGGGGADFLDGTPEAVAAVVRTHAAHGTTSVVPTTLTCPDDVLLHGAELIRAAMDTGVEDGAEILGLHLEGPYFSGASRGAQNVTTVRLPDPALNEAVLRIMRGAVLRWDCAPELDGMEPFLAWLRDHGILGSIGHSAANAETALWAYERGLTHVTHLYCSTTTEHKEGQVVHAGIVEAAYLEDGMTVELIGDGKHIPRETMLLVFKIKGAKRTALITDAMRAAGQNVTESILGGLDSGTRVIVEDGVAKLPDRTSFAGSIATMDVCLRTAVRYGVPVTDAVRSVSLTPAELVGKAARKGSLTPGKDADVVLADDALNVTAVYLRGKKRCAR